MFIIQPLLHHIIKEKTNVCEIPWWFLSSENTDDVKLKRPMCAAIQIRSHGVKCLGRKHTEWCGRDLHWYRLIYTSQIQEGYAEGHAEGSEDFSPTGNITDCYTMFSHMN